MASGGASAHLAGQDDVLVKAASLLGIVDDWRAFLSDPAADGMGQTLQHHERTGRPLGDEDFHEARGSAQPRAETKKARTQAQEAQEIGMMSPD